MFDARAPDVAGTAVSPTGFQPKRPDRAASQAEAKIDLPERTLYLFDPSRSSSDRQGSL
jgi:hypothetical protein